MNRKLVAFLLFDAVVVAAMVAFFFLRGSGLDIEEVPVSSLPPTHAAIALWMDGNQTEAVSLLVEGDAGAVETIHTIPTLNMSEADYMAQSERAIIAAGKFNMEAGKAARDLARALMGQAGDAAATGDLARSRQIKSMVENLANELMRPYRSLFWVQQGESIKNNILLVIS